MSVDERREAAENGDFAQLSLLVVGNVEDDVSGFGDEVTVLHYACKGGSVDCVVLLLEQCNANVDTRDRNGLTPLMTAAQNGHVDVCKVLIQHNVGIEISTNSGYNALHCALQHMHDNCVRLLIEKGAIISNVKLNRHSTGIPSWVINFIAQRERCRHAAIVLLGSLRKVSTLLSPQLTAISSCN